MTFYPGMKEELNLSTILHSFDSHVITYPIDITHEQIIHSGINHDHAIISITNFHVFFLYYIHSRFIMKKIVFLQVIYINLLLVHQQIISSFSVALRLIQLLLLLHSYYILSDYQMKHSFLLLLFNFLKNILLPN